jgi:hypothetical protein
MAKHQAPVVAAALVLIVCLLAASAQSKDSCHLLCSFFERRSSTDLHDNLNCIFDLFLPYYVGRIIVDDGDHDESKLNLPNGMCVYKKHYPICKSKNFCYCCLAGEWCYDTMDWCKHECGVPPGPPS